MGAKIVTMQDLEDQVAAGIDVTKRHRPKVADDTPQKIERYKSMVGMRVCKTSKSNNKTTPKPFKSGFRVNTIKAADFIHPVSGNLCFTFVEDDSYVQCYQCRIAPEGI